MSWFLWPAITVLFLACAAAYLHRRRRRLDRMEEEEKWRESLPESEWDVSDPWSSRSSD